MNICAARHGPRVCELEGPTPILKISNTEIASCAKKKDLCKSTTGLHFRSLMLSNVYKFNSKDQNRVWRYIWLSHTAVT